jgi:hypothetical protein
VEKRNQRAMKTGFALLVLVLTITGCMTKSKSRMQAQLAFLEGQNAALKQQAGQAGVTVTGTVQNAFVPWVAGLTLAQAVATANFTGADEPQQIILTRQGERAALDAQVLLAGPAVPLEPGDAIELR